MAIDQQGIMALPEGQQAMMPQLSYSDSYDAMRQALQQVSPEVDAELQQTLDGLRAIVSDVSDEELQQLIDAVQVLIDDPEGYAQNIAQAIKEGDLEKDAFPEEYDEEFLGAVLSLLLEEQRSRGAGTGMMMPPPQQFARGGIAEAARIVAGKGRNGDTMLAHITPSEARLLRSRGGAGTINPETGLPEFFIKDFFKFVGKTFSRIGKAVKSVLKSPIGRIVGTIALAAVLGPGAGAFGIQGLGLVSSTAAAAGLSSGIITGLAGGGLKDILISAGTGFFGAPGGPVSQFLGSKIANPLIRDALVGAGVGTAAGLLQGQKLKDAVKGGLTAGAISGGMSYLQSRGNLDVAKADAEQAAAAKAAPAVTDVADEITSTPGLLKRTTKYADGRVVEQMVDGRGTPIGPATPVGAAPISGAPMSVGPAPVGVEPAPVPGTTGYLESTKQNIIGRSMGVPTASTPTQIANIQPPVDVSSFDAFQNLRSVTPATIGPSGAPSTISTGGYRYEGGPPKPMPASSANVSAAPRGAPYQTTTPGQYTIPEVGQSLSTMGRGAKDFLSGDFSAGAKTFMEGAEDLFFPGPSDEQIRRFAAERNITPAKAAQEIGAPGFMRTYGPGVAAATGIGALAGAFERQEPGESDFARRMRAPIDLSGDPRAYYIQDLPGVLYDERGTIIGRGERAAPLTLGDIRYPTYSYTNYMPRGYAEGGTVVNPMRVVELVKQGLSEAEAKKRAQDEDNAKEYIVQDLPTAEYDEKGNIVGTTARQGVVPPPVTLERIRAPQMSYTNYRGRAGAGFPQYISPVVPSIPTPSVIGFKGRGQETTTAAPAPAPVEQAPVARPSVREQTTNLFRQYLGQDPTQSQMDYWGGIFELDNEVTPDEIARFQAAIGNSGRRPMSLNMGGIAALKQGGYPRRTGQISGPGTETSDSIPAMLSDGEFVMTARAVRGMGNGSRRDGARKMYALMHKLERNAARG